MSISLNTAIQHLSESLEECKKMQNSFTKVSKTLAGTPAEIEFKGMIVGLELAIREFEKVLDAMRFNNGDIPF